MAIRAIVPPQANPPIDDDSTLFNKTWWLFFRALADSSNTVQIDGSTGVTQEDEPVEY